MPIPNVHAIAAYLLSTLKDGGQRNTSELSSSIVSAFTVTDEEMRERLETGDTVLYSRIKDARRLLKSSGLIQYPAPETVQITPYGAKAVMVPDDELVGNLSSVLDGDEHKFEPLGHDTPPKPAAQPNPELGMNEDKLKTEHMQVVPKQNAGIAFELKLGGLKDISVAEALERQFIELREDLEKEILDMLIAKSSEFFERAVIDLLVAMGYGGSAREANKVGRKDQGIDGVIKEDELGLNKIYVQAKRWSEPVGVSVAREFAGSLDQARSQKGVLITTSRFTKDAIDYVNSISKSIALIDGKRMARLMIDYRLGVQGQATFILYKIDKDYFDGI